jgi:hypothetical protein
MYKTLWIPEKSYLLSFTAVNTVEEPVTSNQFSWLKKPPALPPAAPSNLEIRHGLCPTAQGKAACRVEGVQ